MSFDLGIWYTDKPMTVEEAGELYVKLCEESYIPTEDHPAVEAFYDELCQAYPEIDSLPEDQVDSCPWSCAHDRSGAHVLIAMSFGEGTGKIAEFIVGLAGKHGLLCYDPQGPSVYLPPTTTKKKSKFRFW